MEELRTRSAERTPTPASADPPGSPVVLGVATAAVTTGLLMVTANDVAERLIMTPVVLAVVVLVWGLVVPRGLRSGQVATKAIWLSALALPLTVVAFWAHVPFVLASGGAYLGWVGRRGSRGSGRSIAALVLGLVAMVGYLAMIVLATLTG